MRCLFRIVEEDCCVDTCCSDCDPYLPDVETPFYGTGHQMPDTITQQGIYNFDSQAACLNQLFLSCGRDVTDFLPYPNSRKRLLSW